MAKDSKFSYSVVFKGMPLPMPWGELLESQVSLGPVEGTARDQTAAIQASVLAGAKLIYVWEEKYGEGKEFSWNAQISFNFAGGKTLNVFIPSMRDGESKLISPWGQFAEEWADKLLKAILIPAGDPVTVSPYNWPEPQLRGSLYEDLEVPISSIKNKVVYPTMKT